MPVILSDEHVEKRLASRERTEPEAVARLRSETTLLRLLASTQVTPRLLAHGEDDAGPWHRLERIHAPTLAAWIERGGIAPAWIEKVVPIAFGCLAALHEASDERGPLAVVHADLSPGNVAVDPTGARVVILDFDLASWRDGPARDGAFRGTIAYVAPEVARGERPTPRSDLFALAATLLHAATGTPPRSGPSFAALLAEAAEAPLRTALEHCSERGPGHTALVACLAHEPDARPESARAVIEAANGTGAK